MKRATIVAAVLCAFCAVAAEDNWQAALPGWHYEFPRDHHVHRGFKTEWWYFTGNVSAADGRRFGYELTFFREGVRRRDSDGTPRSRFVVDDIKFAHFTVTDVNGQQFRFAEKTSRGAFGEAGFGDDTRIAWLETWELQASADGRDFSIKADAPNFALQLELHADKPPAIHGVNGVSQKAAGAEHGSHYYSMTRLTTVGRMRVAGVDFAIDGFSWFDHEWATNQLAPEQAGWNWLCVQWDDGSELMLYQMRRKDGALDPSSSGTVIARDGTSAHLSSAAFEMQPTQFWPSAKSGANYPVAWRGTIPDEALQFEVAPLLREQELALGPLTYWEGAVDVRGSRGGQPLSGRGYLELTGYVGPLPGLSR